MSQQVYCLGLLHFLYKAYKIILSPLFGNACRFQPYCSEYAVEAIAKHGWFRGILMACWRIMRCNPCSKGGHDPVK